jgi:hypothetical protein
LAGNTFFGRFLIERAHIRNEPIVGDGGQHEVETGQSGEQGYSSDQQTFHFISSFESRSLQKTDTRWITQNMATLPMR